MQSNKLPAIQFYPGDWRKDIGVQSLNFHDRGVWFEILLLMHDSAVRGKLMLGGKPIADEVLASILKIDIAVLTQTIETLIERGVTEREKRTGVLINRRMLRDENFRSESRDKMQKWRKSKEIKSNGNGDVTPMLPLSSSSSSSSSSVLKNKKPQAAFVLPDWIDSEAWEGFEEMRKKERHPLTGRARKLAISELEKLRASGNDPTEVLNQATLKAHRGLFPLHGGSNGANYSVSESRADRNVREAIELMDREEAESAGRGSGSPGPLR